MASTKGSNNLFKDLGFKDQEAVDLKFKAELYILLIKAVESKKLKSRDLEKLWDIPQPRVSEIITGKLDKVSITRILVLLDFLGVQVTPTPIRKKSA